ncbi:MAG: hypothetical protein V4482_05135 [Pseudomonadota bacterium]
MARFSLIQIPGRSNLRIPIVNKSPANGDVPDSSGVQSPEWMIQMDSFLSSNVNGYTDYCELFGWYGESSRFTSGDVASSLFTSATLRHTDLIVVIPNGGYGTTIESLMNTGTLIQQVTIARLGAIETQMVTLQTLVYGMCRIQKFNQQLDQLIVEMSILTKENTIFVYGQDGTSQGQMVSQVDYSQNKAQ